ncbi:uncharacterized protein DEA37_0001937, partial [Paragonimus westermani]
MSLVNLSRFIQMCSLFSHSVSANFSMSELHKHWRATAKAGNTCLWRSHSNSSTEIVQPNEQTDSGTFSLGQFRATQTEALESELSTYFRLKSSEKKKTNVSGKQCLSLTQRGHLKVIGFPIFSLLLSFVYFVLSHLTLDCASSFSKSSFSDLHVVGQFNLGFIIARHRDDLFIIDQHASDEKFRFEQLCDTYQFTCQPLVTPQALELSVEQEQLLLNNLDVFAKNGFAFRVNESGKINCVCARYVEGVFHIPSPCDYTLSDINTDFYVNHP